MSLSKDLFFLFNFKLELETSVDIVKEGGGGGVHQNMPNNSSIVLGNTFLGNRKYKKVVLV